MTMKKKLCSMVCLCYFVSIMLCACGRKEQGNPIRLPAREDIVSIGVSDGDKYAMSPNTEGEATEFIDEFLSMLMDMETTSQVIIDTAGNKRISPYLHYNLPVFLIQLIFFLCGFSSSLLPGSMI
jgi:predicted small lipoprotein YifL